LPRQVEDMGRGDLGLRTRLDGQAQHGGKPTDGGDLQEGDKGNGCFHGRISPAPSIGDGRRRLPNTTDGKADRSPRPTKKLNAADESRSRGRRCVPPSPARSAPTTRGNRPAGSFETNLIPATGAVPRHE